MKGVIILQLEPKLEVRYPWDRSYLLWKSTLGWGGPIRGIGWEPEDPHPEPSLCFWII